MQKRLLLGLIVILFAITMDSGFFGTDSIILGDFSVQSGHLGGNDPIEPPKDEGLFVARVVDGDKIIVFMDGASEKIRLIGVDTPETVDPRKQVECFGKEASELTKTLLLDIPVILEADPTQGDRDKYGRLLRYVFLVDGTLINEKIISLGYGHEYTYRTPYKYQAEFKYAELSAREAQKRLWAPEACRNS